MITIHNRIAECKALNSRNLRVDGVHYLVIHRVSLADFHIRDDDLDGPALARIFTNEDLGTMNRVPYHLLFTRNGSIEQLVPFGIRGAHARKWNSSSWGLAVVGDFTKARPTEPQWESLVWACRTLAPINGGLTIAGHTELNNASVDQDKVCPGAHLSLSKLTAEVRSYKTAIAAGIAV
jgi:hypothetical protein